MDDIMHLRAKIRKNIFSHALVRLWKSEVGTESAVNHFNK